MCVFIYLCIYLCTYLFTYCIYLLSAPYGIFGPWVRWGVGLALEDSSAATAAVAAAVAVALVIVFLGKKPPEAAPQGRGRLFSS